MQLISFGPHIVDVHSPSERLKISSVGPSTRSSRGFGAAVSGRHRTAADRLQSRFLCDAFDSLVAGELPGRASWRRPTQTASPGGAEAGPGFQAESATRAYLATFKPDQKARSDAYFEGGYWLQWWDLLYGAAVSVLLLATGFSARMRDWASASRGAGVGYVACTGRKFAAVSFVLGLPWAVYAGFVRERQYGLMNQSLGAWFVDEGKGLAIDIVLVGLVVMALLGIVRRLPRAWPYVGAGAAVLFVMIAALIWPVFLAPLFNKYTLLGCGHSRSHPAARAAERDSGVACVSGGRLAAEQPGERECQRLSGDDRVTLNDNLLRRCSPRPSWR